jgi:putative ABC transport system permease protein
VSILRNVFRRKLRAFLTISGITIGVFALVVMGGMAEKINLLVDGGSRFYSDKVTVSDAGSGSSFSANPLAVSKAAEIEAVEGVAAASANIMMLLDEDTGMSFGMPAMIIGTDLKGAELESFQVTYKKGRELRPDDRGKIVVGSDLVAKLGAEVGGLVTIRGQEFEVVGIMDKTLTAPDTSVSMLLPDAQQLFKKMLPEVLQGQVHLEELATGFTVYTEVGVDADQLAKNIEAAVPNVIATGPQGFEDQIGSATQILNAIIFGVALISLLVGGLSVINTMTMSVYERTREIGIRKSIGASHAQIVTHFLAESGAIGLLGGLGGLVLGFAFTYVANAAGNDSGTALFLVTARLAFGSVAFAVLLGTLSGIYPAWHAARMHPVVALRHS